MKIYKVKVYFFESIIKRMKVYRVKWCLKWYNNNIKNILKYFYKKI
jgi:hypothetical protein